MIFASPASLPQDNIGFKVPILVYTEGTLGQAEHLEGVMPTEGQALRGPIENGPGEDVMRSLVLNFFWRS